MSKKLIYLCSSVLVLGLAAGLASGQEVKINFQLQGAPIPEGYLPDYGEIFADRGNGFSYGWDVGPAAVRDRNNASAPDQRYDTLIHMQPSGSPEKTWEIALSNGPYKLFIVCGDPSYADSINTLDVEGTVVTDPDGPDDYDEYTVMVIVRDGRLTIKQAPDPRVTYAKICFVDISLGIPLGAARYPNPAHEATDVPREVVLSWTPGEYAPPVNGHKVYLSENFNDVNDGIGGVTQDANSYAPPQRLDFSTTYYWRVDEVNGPPDHTVFEGDVWSFTTEPIDYPIENITATASSAHSADMSPKNTINGSGLDANDLHSKGETDMWLSSNEPLGAWIEYQFDKVYKLREMWVWNSNQMVEPLVGFGLKDVTIEYSTNGTDYTTLGTTHEFAQAPGTAGYVRNTTVDFGGVAAKYVRLTANSNWGGIMPQYGLSEVRFLYIPVQAREPRPADGEIDVSIGTIDEPTGVTLGFRAGREAATHNVYFGTDEQAVIDGTTDVTTVTEASHGPLPLDLSQTYYWRVDEVNEAETPTTWQGDLWNFTTQEYFILDDIESYNDLDTTDPNSNRIFLTWIDGWEVAANGSQVGYADPPFCEQTIVHGGKQSMPFLYSNTAGAAYSDAERTFAVGQDWTTGGAKTLSLWFSGDPNNTAAQMYVKVNGSKVAYDGDASNLTAAAWQPWNIELASFGVGLQNVTKLSIGIDGNGAAGTLLFDDIRLYPYDRQLITPAEPNKSGLLAHLGFDEGFGTVAGDLSGNGHVGTLMGDPQWVAGKIGGALDFGGDGDHVLDDDGEDYINGLDALTVCMWIKSNLIDTDKGFLHCMEPAGQDRVVSMRYDTAGGSFGGDDILKMGVQSTGGEQQLESSSNLQTTEWQHVTMTWVSEGLIRFYVNGLEDTPTGRNGPNNSGTVSQCENLIIGKGGKDEGANAGWDGLIDDVRIYNRVLSPAEIAWLGGRTKPFDKPF